MVRILQWAVVILVLAYVLNPFDLLPDVVVGAGWLDDLALLGGLLYFLYRIGYRGFPFRGDSPPDQEPTGGDAHESRSAKENEDPYQVLGVEAGADQGQIRQAYRRLAAQYHPDKVAHLGADLRRLAEQKFKAIQAAYDTLRRP
jgi:hypothetical protein